jgi:hypothetical protein
MPELKSVGQLGVLVHLCRGEEGELHLVMDDVASSLQKPGCWERVRLFTEKEMNEDLFMSMKLTDAQLADIGTMLVARLVAFAKQSKSG